MKRWLRLAVKALRDRMHITHLEDEISRLEPLLASVGGLIMNEQKRLEERLTAIETQVHLLRADVADEKSCREAEAQRLVVMLNQFISDQQKLAPPKD